MPTNAPEILPWVSSEDQCSHNGRQRRVSREGGTQRRPSREDRKASYTSIIFSRRRSSEFSRVSSGERPSAHLSEAGQLMDGIASAHEQRWQLWADRLRKRRAKLLVNSLLNTLPDDVMSIYESLETSTGVQLSLASRKFFYEEFLKKASGFETLSCSDVEFLLLSKLGKHVSTAELHNLIHENLERQSGAEVNESEGNVIDFQLFASIVCDILRASSDKDDNQAQKSTSFRLSRVFPLDPDSTWKLVWDMFCMLLLLYCSFSVPYTIAFIPDGETSGMTSIGIFNLIVDIFFMLDMALCFVTSYEEHGFVVTQFHRIANHYFRTWFWPDLAGSFPFDTVSAAILESYHQEAAANLDALKIMRIVKLVRAVKFLNKLNKLKEGDNWEIWGVTISLGGALFLLVFTAHVLGCFFGTFVTASPDHNWLLHYSPKVASGAPWEQYTTAMYWAIVTITTMGYGDVLPITNGERLYCIVVALVGAVVFSHCMGTVSSLISQVAGVDDLYQERLRAVGEYMQFRELPPELRRRVRSHYVHCWRRSPAPFDENNILRELSSPLRSQVLRNLVPRLGSEVPLLEGFDDECVGYVLSQVKRTMFAKGDVIYSRGEPGEDMYLIVTGSALLCWDSAEAAVAAAAAAAAGKTSAAAAAAAAVPTAAAATTAAANGAGRAVCVVGEGQSFGEIGLFPDLLGRRRPDSAVALSWVVAYALSQDNLQALRGRHPEVVVMLRELAEIRAIQARALDPRLAASNSTANASSSNSGATGTGAWGQQELKMTIEKVKGDLLRHRETSLLAPASALSGNPILSLLRPTRLISPVAGAFARARGRRGSGSNSGRRASGVGRVDGSGSCGSGGAWRTADGVGQTEWLELSMVISDNGEVLCVENSVEGIARTRARSFGFLVPGRSSIRVLRRDEVQCYHAPSARRQLFGCAIVCFTEPTPAAAAHAVSSVGGSEVILQRDGAEAGSVVSRVPVAFEGGSGRAAGGNVTQLFTWTYEDFVQLRKAVGAWVGSAAFLHVSASGRWTNPGDCAMVSAAAAVAASNDSDSYGLSSPRPPPPTPSKLEPSPLPSARPFLAVGSDSSRGGDERRSSAVAETLASSCAGPAGLTDNPAGGDCNMTRALQKTPPLQWGGADCSEHHPAHPTFPSPPTHASGVTSWWQVDAAKERTTAPCPAMPASSSGVSGLNHQPASVGHGLQDSRQPSESDAGPGGTDLTIIGVGTRVAAETRITRSATTESEAAKAEGRLRRARQEIDRLNQALETLRNLPGYESRDYPAHQPDNAWLIAQAAAPIAGTKAEGDVSQLGLQEGQSGAGADRVRVFNVSSPVTDSESAGRADTLVKDRAHERADAHGHSSRSSSTSDSCWPAQRRRLLAPPVNWQTL